MYSTSEVQKNQWSTSETSQKSELQDSAKLLIDFVNFLHSNPQVLANLSGRASPIESAGATNNEGEKELEGQVPGFNLARENFTRLVKTSPKEITSSPINPDKALTARIFDLFTCLTEDNLPAGLVLNLVTQVNNLINDKEQVFGLVANEIKEHHENKGMLFKYLKDFYDQDPNGYFQLFKNIAQTENAGVIRQFLLNQEVFLQFIENQHDVTLFFQEKEIKANKALLATFIPYYDMLFHSGFNSDLKEPEDFSPELLFEILFYQLFGEVSIRADNVQELLVMADKFEVKGVKDKCELWLVENINDVENISEMLIFSCRYGLEKVIDCIISHNEGSVTDSPSKNVSLEFMGITGRRSSYSVYYPITVLAAKVFLREKNRLQSRNILITFRTKTLTDDVKLEPSIFNDRVVCKVGLLLKS